jgi:retinol dehydrogenase 12
MGGATGTEVMRAGDCADYEGPSFLEPWRDEADDTGKHARKSLPHHGCHLGHRAGVRDDLQAERGGYRGMKVYGNSKLANILFTRGLKRRLEGTKVTTNSLHPGVVRTGFGLNSEGILKHLMKLVAPFMLSAEGGARTSVYLASSPEVEGVSGKYFIKSKVAKESRAAQDDAATEKLWRKSAELTGVGR